MSCARLLWNVHVLVLDRIHRYRSSDVALCTDVVGTKA